jgi:hypothetical protein
MKDTISNKIDSFDAAIAVADQVNFKALWQGQTPLGFDAGLTALRPKLTALKSKGARQSVSLQGDFAALKDLRSDFEEYLHRLARATFRALTRLGRTEDAGTVNFTPSDLVRARAQALAGMGEIVLDLAEPLSAAPAGGGDAPGKLEGIIPEAVAKVDDLWERYGTAVGAPVGARGRRKALTDSLPHDVRDLEELFSALDDLVIQFDENETGAEFVAAWFNARKVVDLGRRAAKPAPRPASPPGSP